MQIGAEELCDEIAMMVLERVSRCGDMGSSYISSRGEMKMSLSEMT